MEKFETNDDLLLVIDMVNGFVKEGALADKDIARLIPLQKKLIEYYLKENKTVGFVKDSHHEGSREFKGFLPHCQVGTSEAELVEELQPYEEEGLVYEKNSTSVLFAPNFIDDIEAMKELRRIVITGCCTDICVMNAAIPLVNYFNESDRDVDVVVPRDFVDTYNIPEIHEREEYSDMAFKLMQQAGVQTEAPADLQFVLKA